MYIPKPIDTSKIRMDDELEQLIEMLAKNTHENWSSERMAQGWSYGTERNDDKKKHPCLIAYEELTEQEKNYDRVISIEVIKTILALGFKIHK